MSLARTRINFVRSISWVDLCLFSLLLLFVYAMVGVAVEWTGPFRSTTEIDLSLTALPRYAFLSLFRGFAAYFISLMFTFCFGYLAAQSRLAEKILIPVLDILQSVPVLGFLPGIVLVLVQLFPGSNVGLELACVLMIFTSQVWNMTFSFYASVKGVPRDIRDMTSLFRLRAWDVLKKVEIPYSMNGLLWNSMLSMAGGWFFLMVVESFQLGDQDFRLPGIGSYMSVAIERGNTEAVIAGIAAMIFVIVLVDRCLWAPLVYSSSRYRSVEQGSPAGSPPMVLVLLQKSQLLRGYYRLLDRWREGREARRSLRPAKQALSPSIRKAGRTLYFTLIAMAIVTTVFAVFRLFDLLSSSTLREWGTYFLNTLYTFGRVMGAVTLGTLWTVPVGVFIGSNPQWTRRLQPVVQVIAAFPAPMIFPIITYLFLSAGVPFEYGCTLLMLMGSQFYILFNVISGASLIPESLKELGTVYQLSKREYWKAIILPAIFPSLVNGWITAAGGAWNASIVSEFVTYEGRTLSAPGIGSAISEAARDADFAALSGSIVMMITVLVLINRFFWRWMYNLSETRFRLE